MQTQIGRIRDLIAEIPGINEVYAASDVGEDAIPDSLQNFPAVIIYPGPDTGDGYVLNNSWQEHTYEVAVQIFESGGERASSVLPYVDAIIEKFRQNVTLGARATYCVFSRQSGFATLAYGGMDYLGYEITLEVNEQGATTPETGD
jgi:hypothetical protein